jgi:hypothetical protein
MNADQEQFLKLYPNAVCSVRKTISGLIRYNIFAENKNIAFSYDSEARAWRWALKITNQQILNKLKR